MALLHWKLSQVLCGNLRFTHLQIPAEIGTQVRFHFLFVGSVQVQIFCHISEDHCGWRPTPSQDEDWHFITSKGSSTHSFPLWLQQRGAVAKVTPDLHPGTQNSMFLVERQQQRLRAGWVGAPPLLSCRMSSLFKVPAQPSKQSVLLKAL